MASKAAELVSQIAIPRIYLPVKKTDGTTFKLPVAQLGVSHWRDIKAQLDVDMWSILLEIYGKAESMNDDQRQAAGIKLLGEMDYSIQLAMYEQSLRMWDPDITPDEVSHIISYGIEEEADLMRGIFFMLQGASAEEVKEAAKGEAVRPDKPGPESEKAGSADSPSAAEESHGEESTSSSPGGTASAPGT